MRLVETSRFVCLDKLEVFIYISSKVVQVKYLNWNRSIFNEVVHMKKFNQSSLRYFSREILKMKKVKWGCASDVIEMGY